MKLHTGHQRTHIDLSQTSRAAREAYAKESTWKALSRSLGFGRCLEERQTTWKEIYIRVVTHQKTCRVPNCYRYGVPRMSSMRRVSERRR